MSEGRVGRSLDRDRETAGGVSPSSWRASSTPQADRRAPRSAPLFQVNFRATFVAYVRADYGLDCGVSA